MFNRRHLFTSVSLSLAATLVVACQQDEQGGGGRPAPADFQPPGNSGVDGTVEFTPLQGVRIRIHAEVTGLEPGSHGIHIHEFGDCSDPEGLSAGDHFNPEGVAHGGPNSPVRHLGDLGNITADAGGRGVMTIEVTDLTLDNGPRGILGRSVVVHADPDDYKTQPAGMSGARLACAVIRAQEGDTDLVLPGGGE